MMTTPLSACACDTAPLLHIEPGARVLFQGDSITNAFRMPGEINIAYQLGAGYAMMIGAGLLRRRPNDRLSFFNRGVSGNDTGDLLQRWQADCLDLQPDVLSLLVGVNDCSHHLRGDAETTVADFDGHYRQLLDQTLAANPAARLILCEPFGFELGVFTAAHVADLKQRQQVVARIAEEYDAVFVPLQAAFDRAAAANGNPAYWIYDGVHPTAPGFLLIAEQWLSKVG